MHHELYNSVLDRNWTGSIFTSKNVSYSNMLSFKAGMSRLGATTRYYTKSLEIGRKQVQAENDIVSLYLLMDFSLSLLSRQYCNRFFTSELARLHPSEVTVPFFADIGMTSEQLTSLGRG
jgi:hypothetical protein